MRRNDQVFSLNEIKVAVWATVAAGLIALGGFGVKQVLQPSVGPEGADGYVFAQMPGVLPAQPLIGAARAL